MRAVSAEPHVTADEVAEAVRGEIGAISLQSVYDALGVLVTARLIRRIEPAGSPARFEDRVGDNHHHLICRSCGRLVDVDCAVGRTPCLKARDSNGYEIDEAEVVYWGRCPKCLAKSLPPEGGSHGRRADGASHGRRATGASHTRKATGASHVKKRGHAR
jgi:Fur family ferric uptake transcriptional regulator